MDAGNQFDIFAATSGCKLSTQSGRSHTRSPLRGIRGSSNMEAAFCEIVDKTRENAYSGPPLEDWGADEALPDENIDLLLSE